MKLVLSPKAMRDLVRSIVSLTVLLGVNLSILLPVNAEITLLQPYRWQNRILLVFASDPNDDRLQALSQDMDREACEVAARDLVIGVLFPSDRQDNSDREDKSTLATVALSPREVNQLQSTYNSAADDFAIVLIGKDGGVKLQSTAITDLEPIFTRIDGMPMRRQEMAHRGSQC